MLDNVPSTRLAGYRCSLPGLAGFASVPPLGTPVFWHTRAPSSSGAGAVVRPGSSSPQPSPPLPLRRGSRTESRSLDLGGERGIRTLGTFRYTRFPIVRLRPLGHLSNFIRNPGRVPATSRDGVGRAELARPRRVLSGACRASFLSSPSYLFLGRAELARPRRVSSGTCRVCLLSSPSAFCRSSFSWRREWESNPRWTCAQT